MLARPKLRLVSNGTELYGVLPLGLTAFLPSGDTNVSPGGPLTSTMRETLSVREAYVRLGLCAAF